jgi:biopolymer transport protein ExbB/TolQ
MFSGISLGIMHQITSLLLTPVIWALLFFVGLAIYEIGISIGERFGGIRHLRDTGNRDALMQAGKRRIERADFLTRLAPMLGLMGTAMTVAFDTTVIGLLAGMIGFVLGRLRRRWYDQAIQQLSALSQGESR